MVEHDWGISDPPVQGRPNSKMFKEPDAPMWLFLPAVWPPSKRTWMPTGTHRTKAYCHVPATDKTYTHDRPRTQEEQTEIDDDADALLAEAGIAPRPRGRVYYLEVPTGNSNLQDILKLIVQRALQKEVEPCCCKAFVHTAIEVIEERFHPTDLR